MGNYSLLLFIIFSFSLPRYSHPTDVPDHNKLYNYGYFQVRPGAHMFWWHYKSPFRNGDEHWPLILFIQGSSGSSASGFGNFAEIGPLDENLQPRVNTWLRIADLLFVDSPVGIGYSYVNHDRNLAATDERVAKDLVVLLQYIFHEHNELAKYPLYIFGESYGARIAAILGIEVNYAIDVHTLKLELGGVVLGSGWISPMDLVLSWGPLLSKHYEINPNDLEKWKRMAGQMRLDLARYDYKEALKTFYNLQNSILELNVDFYNFMLNGDGLSTFEKLNGTAMKNYSTIFQPHSRLGGESLSAQVHHLMNNRVKQHYFGDTIPKDVTWGEQYSRAIGALTEDFLKPRTVEYDLLCSAQGTLDWVSNLDWNGITSFKKENPEDLSCGEKDTLIRASRTSYANLAFYSYHRTGHIVPREQPCMALKMMGDIVTKSPSN